MKVSIVGAGAAGLYAAHLLNRAGVESTLYEARDRVGGRIWTRPEVGYDPGGEWIDADHPLVLGLADEFGLTLVPSEGDRWYIQSQGIRTQHDPALVSADESFSTAVEGLVPTEEATLDDFLKSLQLPEEGWVRAQLRSDEGEDLDRVGLESWHQAYLPYLEREGGELSAFRIQGGMGQLTDALARGKSVVHREVRSLDELGEGPIVLAVPPFVQLALAGDLLDASPRRALETIRMARCGKVVCRFKSSWWRERGWNGSAFWEGPLQQTWEGGEGVLTAYVCGEGAVALPSPLEMVHELARFFPEAKEQFLEGWMHDWTRDSFALGAFSVRPPGFRAEDLPRRVGQIHFAGEHLGGWFGFIEGALESGAAAARAILES